MADGFAWLATLFSQAPEPSFIDDLSAYDPPQKSDTFLGLSKGQIGALSSGLSEMGQGQGGGGFQTFGGGRGIPPMIRRATPMQEMAAGFQSYRPPFYSQQDMGLDALMARLRGQR